MVDAHYNYILFGEAHARIPFGGAAVETASVEPEHDGLLSLDISCPHVEHAAVLRHLLFGHGAALLLHSHRPPFVTLTHALPFLHGLWGHEAFNFGVGDAEPGHRAFLYNAAHRTTGGVDDFLVFLGRCHRESHQQDGEDQTRFLH